MQEFTLIDQGSALFESASGCILHRDPTSGKVKFLPLGRWRGTLQQEDLPVNYIVLSEHLDMVGVQLKATYTQTRKINCDKLQEKVSNTVGPWKGGKFMPLTQRSFSLNSYCMSKLWFRCGSVDLRVIDIKKITSDIKSWLFADQLEYPEEMVLHRTRWVGGLGLLNVKYKAMAEMTRSFLESALNPKFIISLHHQALYLWHIEQKRDIPDPGRMPYMSEDLWENIKRVKAEGLLNIANMSSGQWYKAFLENNITMEEDENGKRSTKNCKVELAHPEVDWQQSWHLASQKDLSSEDQTFLWRMLHDILPTQSRLHRMGMRNAPTPNCTHCDTSAPDSLQHALVTCSKNLDVIEWLLKVVHQHIPGLLPQQLVLLDLGTLDDSIKFPIVWLISNVLSSIWQAKKAKKKPNLFNTRAVLEARVSILRKARLLNHCTMIDTMLKVTN